METQNSEFDDFFGQARQGGDGFQWKNFALSEKDPNIYRLAPPVKSLRTMGRWSVYDSLHYGYTIPNAENPDKPRHKPFRCIFKKNRATGMVEQDCPECNLLESKENEIKALVAQQIAAGKAPDEAEEFVKGARRLLREHNLDKKHYVLAKNLNNEWGVLKLPHRAMQALNSLIDKYMKENGGKHPLDANGGVWFEFTRKGKGLQTEHYVAIANENLGGGRFQYKSGELTDTDKEGIKKCPDLATLNDNKNLTYDQILALVRSNGDPTIAVQVFGAGQRRAATTQTQAPASTPAPQPVTAAAAVAAAPAPVATTSPSAADQIAALQAQLAALQGKAATPAAPVAAAPAPQAVTSTPPPAQAAPAAPSAPAAPQASFQDLMKLDPKQFLSMFPDPNKK